jgi:hypothetical protein
MRPHRSPSHHARALPMPHSDRRVRRTESSVRTLGGIAASVALHMVVLLWPIDGPEPGAAREGASPADRSHRGSVTLIATPGVPEGELRRRALPPRSQPSPSPDADDPSPQRVIPSRGTAPDDDPASPAPRLGPTTRHPRLWQPTLGRPVSGGDLDLEREIGRYLARRRWTDAAHGPREVPGMSTWTLESRGTSRWGLTPGTLLLGTIAVPLCLNGGTTAEDCGFGLLPNRRQAFARWLDTYVDIDGQSTRYRLEAEWGIRAAAIRARRDAARADTLRRH